MMAINAAILFTCRLHGSPTGEDADLLHETCSLSFSALYHVCSHIKDRLHVHSYQCKPAAE